MLVLSICSSLVSTQAAKPAAGNPKDVPRKLYGFVFPKDYNPANHDRYIFTKFNAGVSNHTTGSWDAGVNLDLLPPMDMSWPKAKPPKGMDQAHFDERNADISSQNHALVQHLRNYKWMYVPNIFEFSNDDSFSPELQGYTWFTRQRASFYTLMAKIFMFGALMFAVLNFWAFGYFNTVYPEERPRSLNNRILDKFVNTRANYRENKKGKDGNCLFFCGFIVACLACALVVYVIRNTNMEWSIASRELNVVTGGIIKKITEISDKIEENNLKNYILPKALHRGETFKLRNSANQLKPYKKAFNDKAGMFDRYFIERSSLVSTHAIWLFFLFVFLAVSSGVAYRKGYKTVNLVGCLVMIMIASWCFFTMGNVMAD